MLMQNAHTFITVNIALLSYRVGFVDFCVPQILVWHGLHEAIVRNFSGFPSAALRLKIIEIPLEI